MIFAGFGSALISWFPQAQPADSSSGWYGPVSVQLPITHTGNPFDPAENDIRVRFVSASGEIQERLAFFSRGKWYARFAHTKPGKYSVRIRQAGKETAPDGLSVELTEPMKMSFVRAKGRRFQLSSGAPFWPFGMNFAWDGPGATTVEENLLQFGALGVNWGRVWACHWDNRNPFWLTKGTPPPDGELAEDALDRIETVVKSAGAAGVYVQLVLQHHGQFSTSMNPNWAEHPWRKQNGGFLESASDFFTNEEARRRTKMFYRYAVARWSSEPAIMAWELFNKVQFTDQVREKKNWEAVGAWHDEMAQYLRSLDPYKHLITTSSELEAPIWRQADYLQGHGYPTSVPGMLAGTPLDARKPLFFGEIGLDRMPTTPRDDRFIIRDGLWTALLSGHSGAGQYWFWDRSATPEIRQEYVRGRAFLRRLGNLNDWAPVSAEVSGSSGRMVSIRPGRSWANSDKVEFKLPLESRASDFGQLSAYLQGQANAKMNPGPWRFDFRLPAAETLRLVVGGVSQAGASLRVLVNGREKVRKDYEATTADRTAPESISVPLPAGPVSLRIENQGADWVQIPLIEIPNLAPLSSAMAARIDGQFVVRMDNATGKSAKFQPQMLRLVGVKDGKFSLTRLDLEQGLVSKAEPVAMSKSTIKITPAAADEVLLLKRIN